MDENERVRNEPPRLSAAAWWAMAIAGALVTIFAYHSFAAHVGPDGYHLPNDGATYVAHNIIRPPLYPFLLDVFWALFGETYLQWVTWFQFGLLVVCALFFSVTVTVFYRLNALIFAFIYLVAVAWPIPEQFERLTHILTEGVAYPLFLATMALSLRSLFTMNLKDLTLLVVVAFLTIMVRQQFLWFLPMIVIIMGYGRIMGRVGNKPVVALAGLIVGALLFMQLFERTYNWVNHGRFIGNPSTGYNIFVKAIDFTILFIDRDPKNVEAFDDPMIRAYLKEVQKIPKRHDMISRLAPIHIYKEQFGLDPEYRLPITGRVTEQVRRAHAPWPEMSVEDWLRFSRMCDAIVTTTLKHEWKRYLAAWVRDTAGYFKSLSVLGGSAERGVIFASYFLAMVGLFFASPRRWAAVAEHERWTGTLLLAFAGAITVLNVVLVTFPEFLLKRYTVYNEVIIWVACVVFTMKLFEDQARHFARCSDAWSASLLVAAAAMIMTLLGGAYINVAVPAMGEWRIYVKGLLGIAMLSAGFIMVRRRSIGEWLNADNREGA